MSTIEFKHVSREFRSGSDVVRALDDTSFEIEKGRFTVILGPSGSGKSTTLNLLGGMDKATSGEIWIDGKDISKKSLAQLTRYRREDVGFVFQFYNLIPNLTAFENVDMAKKISKGQMDTAEALKAVGLEHRMKSFPSQLSGGELQRVSIARIFLKNPPVLILDEATSALDTVTEARIQGAFDRLSEGRTSILIAHRLSTIKNADRIVLIDDGEIKESGTHDQLMAAGGIYHELYETSVV